jgi:hypothetical protein
MPHPKKARLSWILVLVLRPRCIERSRWGSSQCCWNYFVATPIEVRHEVSEDENAFLASEFGFKHRVTEILLMHQLPALWPVFPLCDLPPCAGLFESASGEMISLEILSMPREISMLTQILAE